MGVPTRWIRQVNPSAHAVDTRCQPTLSNRQRTRQCTSEGSQNGATRRGSAKLHARSGRFGCNKYAASPWKRAASKRDCCLSTACDTAEDKRKR